MDLCVGHMVAIVPKASPLADKARIDLSDLAGQPMIVIGQQLHFGRLVIEAFKRAEIPLRMWADVPYSQLACTLVNAGAGVAIIDPFTVLDLRWPNVVVRPLREKIAISVTVLTAKTRPTSLVGVEFCRLLEQVSASARIR
jgi:DNA-binding transcriptional LysR family regulator